MTAKAIPAFLPADEPVLEALALSMTSPLLFGGKSEYNYQHQY